MILNKKMVRKNKALKVNQKLDKKTNRSRALERGGVLKKNIGKVVNLYNDELVGNVVDGAAASGVTADVLLTKLQPSGLTGMSGNGFLVAEKIKAYIEADGKTIIINGAECEPGLLNDVWLMQHKANEIRNGAKILKAALNPSKIVLATRGKNSYIDSDDNMEVVKLPLKYPMGEEHILIHQLLGKEISPSVAPAKEGILVINVQTVYQIFRIINGTYDGGRFVTLANLLTGEARVAYVDATANITSLLASTFGKQNAKAFAGGGIGTAVLVDSSATFTPETSFAAFAADSIISNENACKKCGGCSKKCPMGIKVKDIVLAKESDQNADVSAFGADKCIHCGTCTYFCMASKDPGELVYNSKN